MAKKKKAAKTFANTVWGRQVAATPKRVAAQKKTTARAFTPFRAQASPPPNAYDPALDSQLRAGGRGLFDLGQDVETGGERRLSDLLLGQQDFTRQRDEGLADLLRSRTAARENYDADVGTLDRNYQRLGRRQDEAAAVAGVQSGGALVQALGKRQANQQIDRQPIDTGFRRFTEQAGVDEQRINQGFDRGMGGLASEYQRQVTDDTTKLSRAGREQSFFGQDIGQQKWFQATQGGYVAPSKPANERSRHGLTFQVGGLKKPVAKRTYTMPSGRRLDRKGFVGLVRKRKGR